jgi:hypothetical protein
MKYFAISMTTASLLLLQGCVATLSPEQLKAQKTATLNVYEDNRIALKNVAGYNAFYAWSDDQNTIVAVEVNGQLYNGKDIVSIENIAGKRTSSTVTIQLKDGKKINAAASLQNAPTWTLCDKNKNCSAKKSFTDTNYMNNLYRIFTSASVPLLESKSHQQPSRDLLRNDYASVPTVSPYSTSTMHFLNDDERQQLDQKIQNAKTVAAQNDAERDAQFAAGKQKYEQEKRTLIAQWAKAKIGAMISCSSNVLDTHPSRIPNVPLNCGLSGTLSLHEMHTAGWDLVDSRPRQIVQLGQQHTAYEITVRKNR